MELNDYISNILSFITSKNIKGLSKLVRVTRESIILNEQIDISKKLIRKKSKSSVDIKSVRNLMNAIANNVIRLNHLGICYFCKDIQKETNYYKNALRNSRYSLYEENSGNPKIRWLFIGNVSNWEDPLFEIVLIEGKTKASDKSTPHFQIDLDTNLSYGELNEKTKKIFGKELFDWKMSAQNIGIVLAMGNLGEVNGIKIRIALGTKLRDTEYHRKFLLTKLI